MHTTTAADTLGTVVWGTGKKPFRVPTPAEAQDKVLTALLNTPLQTEHRNPLDWLASLVIHVVLLLGILIAPLAFTQVIDLRHFQVTYLVAPAPPPPSPPPALRAAEATARPQPVIRKPLLPSTLVAPAAIPKKVAVSKEMEAPEAGVGVAGGIPGGVPGGILNAIVGGTGTVPAIPAPPPTAATVETAAKTILRVGGDVKSPRALFTPQPHYPPLARSAHIQGCVVIEATLDEHGNVVNAHAVEGAALLIPEALHAVMQWKYEPTLLNGVAYPVTMTVTVTFSFS